MGKLDGRVAIITGVGPNIGRAVARAFAMEGARIAINHHRAEMAQRTVDIINREGGDAIAVPGGITDEEHVRSAVRAATDRWGRVDILVNNAAHVNPKGVLDMSYAEFKAQVEGMLHGTFLYAKYAALDMVERGVRGSIINVVTCAAWQGEPGNIGYTTAKSGIVNFTRSAAMELARHGIRVNSFTPTATEVDDEEALALRRARAGTRGARKFTMDYDAIPLGRKPRTSDYTPGFIYLASDDSAMVTGTNLSVDGGVLAKYWAWSPSTGA
ncbi:MAG: SDR family oxidoreductase [SAR202 cluster bacterium]|nr:SDR family oxidoreductase [SAR202 cluster bacterium]